MGFDFKKFLLILTSVAPVVMMAMPGGSVLAPLIPLIVKGIGDAQQKPGATGPEKKAFVLAIVEDAVKGTALVNPKLIDPVIAMEAAGLGIDAVITTINAVQTAHAAAPAAVAAVPAVIAIVGVK